MKKCITVNVLYVIVFCNSIDFIENANFNLFGKHVKSN